MNIQLANTVLITILFIAAPVAFFIWAFTIFVVATAITDVIALVIRFLARRLP